MLVWLKLPHVTQFKSKLFFEFVILTHDLRNLWKLNRQAKVFSFFIFSKINIIFNCAQTINMAWTQFENDIDFCCIMTYVPTFKIAYKTESNRNYSIAVCFTYWDNIFVGLFQKSSLKKTCVRKCIKYENFLKAFIEANLSLQKT